MPIGGRVGVYLWRHRRDGSETATKTHTPVSSPKNSVNRCIEYYMCCGHARTFCHQPGQVRFASMTAKPWPWFGMSSIPWMLAVAEMG